MLCDAVIVYSEADKPEVKQFLNETRSRNGDRFDVRLFNDCSFKSVIDAYEMSGKTLLYVTDNLVRDFGLMNHIEMVITAAMDAQKYGVVPILTAKKLKMSMCMRTLKGVSMYDVEHMDFQLHNLDGILNEGSRIKRESGGDTNRTQLAMLPVEDEKADEDCSHHIICGVCYGNKRKLALSCGHQLCGSCTARMLKLPGLCPFCRVVIRKLLRLYYN